MCRKDGRWRCGCNPCRAVWVGCQRGMYPHSRAQTVASLVLHLHSLLLSWQCSYANHCGMISRALISLTLTLNATSPLQAPDEVAYIAGMLNDLDADPDALADEISEMLEVRVCLQSCLSNTPTCVMEMTHSVVFTRRQCRQNII